MSLRMSFLSAAAGLAVVLASLAPAGAQTAQDRMKQCGEEWQSAKTAGKVKEGETWNAFFKECNARLQQGAAATPAAAPAATAPATAEKPAAGAAKTTAETGKSAAAASSAQSRRKQCSDEWQAAKTAGKVKAGETWSQFYSACNTRLLGEAPAATPAAATATTAPAKPASQSAVKPVEEPLPTPAGVDTGEGARQPTPGQLAARERIKECGAEWRGQKEAGKIPEGQTWPQYWSACNTRLKAAGK